ncbi:MAG: CSLREA domain-containing protein [Anaerolineales bacterium]|nr:CSLREA domain-containing protein [Anaerolineales bacterium]
MTPIVLLLSGMLSVLAFQPRLPAQDSPSIYLPLASRVDVLIAVNTFEDELNDDGDCALREAIQASNTQAPVDECPAGKGNDVILLQAGVYTLTIDRTGPDDNSTGDLYITSIVTLLGAGRDATIVRAAMRDRVFQVGQNADVVIGQLTVENGLADFAFPGGLLTRCGGGGLLNAGRLALVNATLRDNQTRDGLVSEFLECGSAPWGGAICNLGAGRLRMTHTSVIGNRAGKGANVCYRHQGSGGHGGAIHNLGELIVEDSLIAGNEGGQGFPGGFAGSGGGIYNDVDATLVVISSTITGNAGGVGMSDQYLSLDGGGGHGGGLYNRGIFTITHSAITGNTAGEGVYGHGGSGGGIYNDYREDVVSIISSTIADNIAGTGHTVVEVEPPGGSGGGIYNEGVIHLVASSVLSNVTGIDEGVDYGDQGGGIANLGVLTVTNSTFSHNQAREDRGGGIFNDGFLYMDHATVVSNTAATDGGGIDSTDGEETAVKSTLFGGNTAGGAGSDCAGTISSSGHNLIVDTGGCTIQGDETGNVYGQPASITELGDWGGPTWTHELEALSPAVDAGACDDLTNTAVLTDQRGVARPQGTGCDIGAVETGTTGR